MAKINTKLSLNVPQEITVPLVRADHLATANVYRAFFEIFLALASAMTGTVSSVEKTTPLQWLVLVSCAVFAGVFLVLHNKTAKAAASTE